MINIIPIVYLIILSFILTPVFVLLILQFFNFQLKEYNVSIIIQKMNLLTLSTEDIYSIANICIDHKKFSLALTLLEDRLYQSIDINANWQARYCNAIGFIFNSIYLNITAKKYYEYACNLDPEYLYSSKNLKSISN